MRALTSVAVVEPANTARVGAERVDLIFFAGKGDTELVGRIPATVAEVVVAAPIKGARLADVGIASPERRGWGDAGDV